MKTRVGIVVPVRNCLDYTIAAVGSIKTQYDHRVIVVDDHSYAPTKTWLSRNPQIVSIIDPPNGTGLAYNWNLGIRTALEARCSHVLVINNDILLHPLAIDNLVSRLDRNDVVMATGFDIRDLGMSPGDLAEFVPSDIEEEHPNFSCFMINEKTISKVGWFDENYIGAYGEDADYLTAILLKGEKAICTRAALIYHHGGRTLAENSDIGNRIHQAHDENRAYYVSKWGMNWCGLHDKAEALRKLAISPGCHPVLLRDEFHRLKLYFINRVFRYNRVGFDSRPMVFQDNHRIGRGSGGREIYWGLHSDEGVPVVEISGNSGRTCVLRDCDGVWKGDWVDAEKMPIELTPLPLKLDIGSGSPTGTHLKGDWLGVDLYSDACDVISTSWNLPYEEGGVEEINVSGALQCVTATEVPTVLNECYRVLRSGGVATIQVPDLAWCCHQWLARQSVGREMDLLFGRQLHAGERHKTGFNESLLCNAVEAALFEVVRVDRVEVRSQMTLSVKCRKPGRLGTLFRQVVLWPSDVNEHLEFLRELGSGCTRITEICDRTLESTIAFLQSQPAEFVAYNTGGRALPEAISLAVADTATLFSFRHADSLALDIEPTDLLFIDNVKTYGYLGQELLRHSRQVRQFIVMHDTTVYADRGDRNGEAGIWLAIQEFVRDSGDSWGIQTRVEYNNGLTVLARLRFETEEFEAHASPEDDGKPTESESDTN